MAPTKNTVTYVRTYVRTYLYKQSPFLVQQKVRASTAQQRPTERHPAYAGCSGGCLLASGKCSERTNGIRTITIGPHEWGYNDTNN